MSEAGNLHASQPGVAAFERALNDAVQAADPQRVAALCAELRRAVSSGRLSRAEVAVHVSLLRGQSAATREHRDRVGARLRTMNRAHVVRAAYSANA